MEWDSRKALSNLQKHGIDFADAVVVLEDENAVTVQDTLSAGETRYITVGLDAPGRVLTVVYTWRGDNLRLISARQATPRERRQYGERT
jgi:uncharacterized DUF497 family protein